MKLTDDTDFGGPLNALAWVCILVIPLCLLGVAIGSPEVSDKATKILLADFGLLGSFIGLKTMAIARRSNREQADRGDAGGGRDA